MADDFDETCDEVVADIARAQQIAGEKIVDVVKDRISTPVGYAIGPRGGSKKIRSKPGEPPRRDTGRLMKSIRAETIGSGDQVATSISPGDVPYAEVLQQVLDRPILDGILDATEDLVLDSVAEAIENP